MYNCNIFAILFALAEYEKMKLGTDNKACMVRGHYTYIHIVILYHTMSCLMELQALSCRKIKVLLVIMQQNVITKVFLNYYATKCPLNSLLMQSSRVHWHW